jgi:hypothetical protein
MSTMHNGAVVTAFALLVGLGSVGASAQDSKDRTVEQYTCKDVM